MYIYMKWSSYWADEIKTQLIFNLFQIVCLTPALCWDPDTGLPLAIEFALSILNDNNKCIYQKAW